MTPEQRALLDQYLSYAVYALWDGIETDGKYEKMFADAGIDWDMLEDCCMDNIVDAEDEDGEREINYNAAIADYEESVAKRETKENRNETQGEG